MENNDVNKQLPKVELIDGGPIRISGNIILEDLKRDIATRGEQTVYLCTCGNSSHMPYCDESHLKKFISGRE
jgi:CDGSH-type Zn-finger protein